MFLGDANQVASGFRVPSFKGALRFWWRAIVWSRMTGDSASATLRDLHDREASLFGLASGSESSTQSKVLLSAEAKLKPAVDSASVSSSIWSEDRVEGVGYLKGQGVTRRNAIPSGTVRLRIMFRSCVCDEDRRDIERALFAFGLLGGLGSRSRRGLGSCALESLEGNRALDLDPPKRKSDFKPALEWALGKLVPEAPPFSAFSSKTRIDISVSGSEALSALGTVGVRLAAYRKNIKSDAHIAGEIAKGKDPRRAPSRVSFGLPLPFFFKDTETSVVFGVSARRGKRDRRASPLFMHVHCFDDEPSASRYAVIHTFLPATFLPGGDGIKALASRKSNGRRKRLASLSLHQGPLDTKLILNYLDGFENESGFESVVSP